MTSHSPESKKPSTLELALLICFHGHELIFASSTILASNMFPLVGGCCVSQEAPKHVPPSCTSSNADAAILFAALWHGVPSPIGFEATKGLQYLNPKLHVTMWKICWKFITNTPPGFFPWGRNHFAKFVTRVLKFPREWSSSVSFKQTLGCPGGSKYQGTSSSPF